MKNIRVLDFGIQDYKEVLKLQERCFEKLVQGKKEGFTEDEYLLLGEHPSVITLGRKAQESNILVSPDSLNKFGIEVFHIGRGGDVTYHAPGQLIVYPIIDLDRHKLGVKDYIYLLEECVIQLLKYYSIEGSRIEGATGVWIGKGTHNERKICAMGIKCSRYCTMHGLALNVNTDLQGFSLINPCGFQDKGVTSIKEETGKEFNIKRIKNDFLHIFFSLIFPFEKILDFTEKLGSENEII
ncbi:MAG: lipoyl(octanoyl) transferase LipB [Muribaculaceae bacterium]|nr:lipoyl(octanoyl) transferase LipB [Muribaculaceae bacterium]